MNGFITEYNNKIYDNMLNIWRNIKRRDRV